MVPYDPPMKAVILAAGRGSRLPGHGVVKPLVPVKGVPLIDRVLGALKDVGVRSVVVVVGFEADSIRAHLRDRPHDDLTIMVVDNPDWELANGVSVLAAAEHVRGPTLLSMADHLYDATLPKALLMAGSPRGGALLAVDRAIGDVFDINDATKVRLEGQRIVDIGKELPSYDAVDTGVFLITEGLVEALHEARQRQGDCSLSDGVRRLAGAGKMHALDVTGAFWLDVDTPEAWRFAESRFSG